MEKREYNLQDLGAKINAKVPTEMVYDLGTGRDRSELIATYIGNGKRISIIILGMLLWSCMPPQNDVITETLFRKVPAKYSGVNFVNHVYEKLEYLDKFNYVYNGGGVAIGDINNDGLQDICFTGNEVENKLFLNEGNLKFKDITIKAHLIGIRGWNNGVSMVDINSDGFLDIYICRGGWHDTNEQRKNLLFINQGNATFKEMGAAYGIDDAGYSTQASFFDFDNDSDLDLYILLNDL